MPSNQQTYKLYVQGITYYNDKKYSDAIGYFKRILRINSSDFLALFGMCLVYTALEDYEVALDYANKCLYHNSQYQPAINYKKKLGKKIETSNLEKYERWSKLGLKYYKDKNYLKSHYYYEKAYVCNPNSKVALKNLKFIQSLLKSRLPYEWNAKALEFYKQKKYEKARVCLKHALSLNPNSQSIKNNIVKISKIINDKKAKAQELNKKLKSVGNPAETSVNPNGSEYINESINNENIGNNSNNNDDIKTNTEYMELNDLINNLIYDTLETQLDFEEKITKNLENKDAGEIDINHTADNINMEIENNEIVNRNIDIEIKDNTDNSSKLTSEPFIEKEEREEKEFKNNSNNSEVENNKNNKFTKNTKNNNNNNNKIRRDLIPFNTGMGVDLSKLPGNTRRTNVNTYNDSYSSPYESIYKTKDSLRKQEYEQEYELEDSNEDDLMVVNLNNEEVRKTNDRNKLPKNNYEDDKDKFEYYIDDVYEDYEEPIF
ncbi:tetratricopeptide (TPR) repeat protein [Methanococcus voltae]|uniref:tetratricopeptide repeat protein n=1 Tax=Methanococcus voltae TaxID=2188 RepID=UPI001AE346B1|nr:tetratricopeptide repeat protein [Methanococcus voltae]MBP2142866.1 tetratricopeptide (TPR) repeat protein [Methanococcus voltae]